MPAMMGLFTKPRERPYLRICKKCGGKGQVSFLDRFQQKTYAPCEQCSNGSGPYALGVSLKCTCQKPAVPYAFLLGPELRQFKGARAEDDLQALALLQTQLGVSGTAVLLLCDTCGKRYLAKDGAAERRKISTQEEMNDEDKEFNRHIAATLTANGICIDLDASPSSRHRQGRCRAMERSASMSAVSDTAAAGPPVQQAIHLSANPLSSCEDGGEPTWSTQGWDQLDRAKHMTSLQAGVKPATAALQQAVEACVKTSRQYPSCSPLRRPASPSSASGGSHRDCSPTGSSARRSYVLSQQMPSLRAQSGRCPTPPPAAHMSSPAPRKGLAHSLVTLQSNSLFEAGADADDRNAKPGAPAPELQPMHMLSGSRRDNPRPSSPSAGRAVLAAPVHSGTQSAGMLVSRLKPQQGALLPISPISMA